MLNVVSVLQLVSTITVNIRAEEVLCFRGETKKEKAIHSMNYLFWLAWLCCFRLFMNLSGASRARPHSIGNTCVCSTVFSRQRSLAPPCFLEQQERLLLRTAGTTLEIVFVTRTRRTLTGLVSPTSDITLLARLI